MKKTAKQLALVIISSVLCVTQHAYSQVIQTVVGNGTAGYSGDGGPATSASLAGPHGIFFYNGQLVIADMYNSAIRYVNSSGYIYSLYSGSFSSPMGVALDGNGYIYVADGDWGTIREFQGGNDPLNLDNNPGLNLTLDSTRTNLFCIHEYGNIVTRVNTVVPYGGQPNGIVTTIAGNGTRGYSGDGGPATSASLNVDSYYFQSGYAIVSALTLDNQGNVYIADIGNNVIRKVGTNRVINTVAGKYSPGGGFSGDGGPATNAQLLHPAGVAVDTQGNLYIADSGNNRIRRVDHVTGIITTVAGTGTAGYSGDGGASTSATLNSPSGLAFDASGNLYISDTGNNVIRKVTLSVTITTTSSPTAGGTTSGGGTKTYDSSVTVTATPASCYSFVNWTVGGTQVSTSSNYTFTANANQTLVANFALNTYSISTSSYPANGGTTSGGGTVNCGSSVTVTAIPAPGYTFVDWTEHDSSSSSWDSDADGSYYFAGPEEVTNTASYTFTVTGPRTLTAHFSTNCTGTFGLLVADYALDWGVVVDQSGNTVWSASPIFSDIGVSNTFPAVAGQHYTFTGHRDATASISAVDFHLEFFPFQQDAYIDLSGEPYEEQDGPLCQ
jgi:sugar lactone lactonase YvrE